MQLIAPISPQNASKVSNTSSKLTIPLAGRLILLWGNGKHCKHNSFQYFLCTVTTKNSFSNLVRPRILPLSCSLFGVIDGGWYPLACHCGLILSFVLLLIRAVKLMTRLTMPVPANAEQRPNLMGFLRGYKEAFFNRDVIVALMAWIEEPLSIHPRCRA